MSNANPSSTLLIYGRRAAFLAVAGLFVGVYWNATRQTLPDAPSAEGISQTTEPADKFDPAARNICSKSIDTLLMCETLKKKYPALTSATINAAVQFSKFYGHTNPSGLLAYQLVETKGDIIDGFSEYSSGFGPMHYVVDTFSDYLITDVKVVGKKVRRENALLIQNVKRHFPNNPGVIDEVAQLCTDYMAATREDLAKLKNMPKNLNKDQLEAATTEIKTRVKTRRLELRKKLLEEYPEAVIAIQYVHKLTTTKPETLYSGSGYIEHVLWTVGAERLQNLIERENINRDEVTKAIADKKPVKNAQTIKPVHIQAMLARINAAQGTHYKEMVIPPYAGEIYPAFTTHFSAVAPGNFGIFFKTQKIEEEKIVPSTVRGAPPTKIVKLRVLVTPRSAAEVKAEILRRWEEHHKNARPLDEFAKKYTSAPTAPTTPAYTRTAQNAAAKPVLAN